MSSLRTENLVDVTMPQMGVSVAEGTVVAWRVEVGDRIEAEQTICEISTDKIDTEVPAPVTGIVAEILVEVDTTVEVGVVLARIATGDGGAAAVPRETVGGGGRRPDSFGPARGRHARGSPARSGGAGGGPARGGGAGDGGLATPTRSAGRRPAVLPRRPADRRRARDRSRQRAGDGARRTRAQAGRDGARGRQRPRPGGVREAQPPLHIESPYRPDPEPAAVTSSGEGLSRMRRQIGEHMKRSLDTAATCTTWIEADMSRVEAARRQLGVTALAFVARATIAALREHPALNAWLEGDRYTRVREVHLGIAVSLGDDGLIVPIIHNAHELSEEGLAARIRDLAQRARARQLTPDEVQGGTFTITAPGQYGSIMATPIINQPQVGILDFEAVVKRPVVVTDADGNDSIAIRPITILGLSWDHRALDGALSAQFLATVKRELEGR